MKDFRQYLSRVSPDFITRNSKRIKPEDIHRITDNREQIRFILSRHARFQEWIPEIDNMLNLVSDYQLGKRKEVPFPVIEAITFTLFFIYHPIELSSDFYPIVGQIDEAALFAVCYFLAQDYLPAVQGVKPIPVIME
ncbi:MAG: DUF1232 domain-containing protein [Bacteroidetes bacterium]|nr:DUF1232 domain-containing protein [Bacteroidota bacterium]